MNYEETEYPNYSFNESEYKINFEGPLQFLNNTYTIEKK